MTFITLSFFIFFFATLSFNIWSDIISIYWWDAWWEQFKSLGNIYLHSTINDDIYSETNRFDFRAKKMKRDVVLNTFTHKRLMVYLYLLLLSSIFMQCSWIMRQIQLNWRLRITWNDTNFAIHELWHTHTQRLMRSFSFALRISVKNNLTTEYWMNAVWA